MSSCNPITISINSCDMGLVVFIGVFSSLYPVSVSPGVPGRVRLMSSNAVMFMDRILGLRGSIYPEKSATLGFIWSSVETLTKRFFPHRIQITSNLTVPSSFSEKTQRYSRISTTALAGH
jgi:hypothetical protein